MDRLLALLTAFQGDGVFNQYRDVQAGLDLPRPRGYFQIRRASDTGDGVRLKAR